MVGWMVETFRIDEALQLRQMRQRLCACCRGRVEPRAESPRKHFAAECLEDHYTPKAGSLAFSVQNSPHSAGNLQGKGKIDT